MPSIKITYLEMCSPSEIRPRYVDDSRFRIAECTVKQGCFNRFFYLNVGGAWAWHEKRDWSESQWNAYAEAEALRTFAAYLDGSPLGYFELLETEGNAIEIAYFGLLPKFYGRGFGAAMLTRALEEAWTMNPNRVWVHTCTNDHVAALANYQARGMTIYQEETISSGES